MKILEILSALKISKQYESLLSAMKIFLYSSHDMQSSHSSFLHFPVKISVYCQFISYCKYLPNLSDGGSGADDSFAAGGGGGADIASGLSLAGAGNISFLIYWLKGAKY